MYTDGDLDDDDIEGKRSYKIEEKITNNRHNRDYVRKLHGEGKEQKDFMSQLCPAHIWWKIHVDVDRKPLMRYFQSRIMFSRHSLSRHPWDLTLVVEISECRVYKMSIWKEATTWLYLLQGDTIWDNSLYYQLIINKGPLFYLVCWICELWYTLSMCIYLKDTNCVLTIL